MFENKRASIKANEHRIGKYKFFRKILEKLKNLNFNNFSTKSHLNQQKTLNKKL